MGTYVAPALGEKAFNCPHCGVLAEQTWSASIQCHYDESYPNGATTKTSFTLPGTAISKCKNCKEYALWRANGMKYPLTSTVELPNEDLPNEIKADYNEAKNIVNLSPRGAAALLRLTLQKLCIHLGEKGKNINDDIAHLVEKGLPIPVQQALDIIRVSGNHAVHPGTIEIDDRLENALALFGLINYISNHFLTQPKYISSFYNKLPERDRTNIERRDA